MVTTFLFQFNRKLAGQFVLFYNAYVEKAMKHFLSQFFSFVLMLVIVNSYAENMLETVICESDYNCTAALARSK